MLIHGLAKAVVEPLGIPEREALVGDTLVLLGSRGEGETIPAWLLQSMAASRERECVQEGDMNRSPRRLIEVDLPIKRISAHARREKSIRHGHISTLHIWWARRPLAACRAVICASLWPDPAQPDIAPVLLRFWRPHGRGMRRGRTRHPEQGERRVVPKVEGDRTTPRVCPPIPCSSAMRCSTSSPTSPTGTLDGPAYLETARGPDPGRARGPRRRAGHAAARRRSVRRRRRHPARGVCGSGPTPSPATSTRWRCC